MRIGWIGLGKMGTPMAKNLVQAGFDVTVYNRTRSKLEPLLSMGAKAASSLEDLADKSDVIITMLSDGQAVREILIDPHGVGPYLRPSHTIVDMSTIGPDESREMAEHLRKRGILMVDAPVSGSVKPAEDGTLVILVGGDRNAYEICQPIFRILGKASYYMGENGKGLEAKLAVNLMLGITLQGISEAVLLAEAAGIDRRVFLDMMTQTAVWSPILQAKLPSYQTDSYPAAFSLAYMNKDLRLAVQYGGARNCKMPMTTAASTTFASAEQKGKGALDASAILLEVLELSGRSRVSEKENRYEESCLSRS
jgi:3-hydroxyisobutyrate dehydrogenase